MGGRTNPPSLVGRVVFSAAAILCLSSVIFHEARGEPLEGQIAVAQVVLNRVKDKRWPNKVCAVVKQPKQFSWYGKKGLTNAKVRLATRVINGNYSGIVNNATHFRSDRGRWKRLRFVIRIGRHRFYK